MTLISDPRVWPTATSAEPFAALHRHAAHSLAAATAAEAECHDVAIRSQLRACLDHRDGSTLSATFESAPSSAVYRHLWRELVQAEAASEPGAVTLTVFAIPLTILAGREGDEGEAVMLPSILGDPSEVSKLLREHGGLRGNKTFALASSLVAADTIDIPNLASIRAWHTQNDDATLAIKEPRDLAAAPIFVGARDARVHLRFLVGAAIAAGGVDLLGDTSVGRWAMPLARLLGRALKQEGVTLLILPQPAKRLCVALQRGRAAQREVSAQLFVSNALRKLRASIGEPVAVISAHRVPDVVSGGELRVSLSSPFDPSQAEGYRCPLYRADQPGDVAEMLVTLLRDCRVADIRILPGIHADCEPATGLPLLFKADAFDVPSSAPIQ